MPFDFSQIIAYTIQYSDDGVEFNHNLLPIGQSNSTRKGRKAN